MKVEISHIDRKAKDTITLDQYVKKRQRRRKNMAKRMALKYPLFAVQFIKEVFPDYTSDTFESDIEGKKRPKYKKGRSQLKRMGRYPLYQKAMTQYALTKNVEFLYQAQKWRKKMYLRYEIVYRCNGEKKLWSFPPQYPVKLIQDLAKITFTTWEELEKKTNEKLKYAHIN